MSRNKVGLPCDYFNEALWDDPDTWPHDRPGYVFLARAFDPVGRALFGDHWDALEIVGEAPAAPPADADEAAWGQYEILSDQHDEREEKAEGVVKARRDQIARMIAEQAELKKFETRALLKNGEMAPIKPSSWNADYLHDRFYECKISIAGERCWIFIERTSLQQFVRTQPHAEVVSAGARRYSPYLTVMLAICEKMNITPEQQPKKSVIEAEIKQMWLHSNPLSQKLLSAMATLVREPDSQQGRRKKTRLS